MKIKSLIFSVFLMMFVIGTGIANANGEKKPNTIYKVKVEVKELTNRIVEGKVRNHTIFVDQPTEFGGDNIAPTPPETLAFALGACVVSAGRLIAIQKKLDVDSIQAIVESELDFARALGISKKKRAGFSGFKIVVKINSNMSIKQKQAFLKEIETKCPMCDNLQNQTPINYELRE